MNCAGNDDLVTPAMDSLAASGVRFDRAYCSHPLCVPSRTSMFTGRMPHENGVTINCVERDHVRLPMLGTILAEAGYESGYFGKWHIALPPGKPDAHGFTVVDRAVQNRDDLVPSACAEFFRRERSSPFLAIASFRNPHDICQYARGQELPQGPIGNPPPAEQCPALPGNFEIPDHEPDVVRAIQPLRPRVYPTIHWNSDQWRQYRWAYYRLIEKVDSEVGRLLDALRDSGHAEDTVVIFTSDHGDGHGAHRWNQKSVFYEEETRVPLILSHHGVTRAGQVATDHLVSTGLDLIPTLCDYAGIEPPPELRGRSIRTISEGVRPDGWRDSLVVETALLSAPEAIAIPGRMLRSRRFKYIAYAEGELREQLFDLEQDPGEVRNLAVDPSSAAALDEHRGLLADWCRETRDPALELFLDLWPASPRDQELPRTAWARAQSLEAAGDVVEWLVLITGKRPCELNRDDFRKYGLESVLEVCFEASVGRAVECRYPGTVLAE